MSGLYIHIPFCVRKCSYCAFYSVVSGNGGIFPSFFKTLGKEIQNLPPDFSPESVFIGGGTPTAPDFQTLEKFFPLFGNLHPVEFSCEVNPGTVDAAKLALLRESGVNRLSIGIQSFNVQCLETLGRIHTAGQAETAFRLARAAGFENISLDLIFGIPNQTAAMLESDLDRALALNPEHLSIYNLMYEEGTPLAERDPPRLDEELEREMYDLIRERLKEAGFLHYEISNFAKPGFECQHNLLYWSGGEYIGLGPAAHSHWKGVRRANAADLDDYCVNGPRCEFEETLDPDAKERETLVMGLRLLQGVEVSAALWEQLKENFQAMEKEGLLIIAGNHIRLAGNALFVSDSIYSELV
jgi:oxygen-independent coproporphyrinogen-3 oxidase